MTTSVSETADEGDGPPITCTPELSELLRQYDEAKGFATHWADTAEGLRAAIVAQLDVGPGRHPIVENGTPVATYTVYGRSTFDSLRFRKHWPDLYRQFCSPRTSARLVVHSS